MKRNPGESLQGTDIDSAGMSRRSAMAFGVGGALVAATGTMIAQAAPAAAQSEVHPHVRHSMGGAVALRHGARFGNRVGKLVLAEAAAPKYVFGPKSAQLATGLAGLIDGYATNRAATVHGLARTFFTTHTDVDNDPFLQYFRRQCLDEASLQASRAGLVALRNTDLSTDLWRVKVPTRIFHAVHDAVVPFDHGQALAAGIPGAKLITFHQGGHGIYVDEPAKFDDELLRFVKS